MEQNPKFVRAKKILSTFSPDLVKEMEGYLKTYGPGAINDLYQDGGDASTTIFAVLDRAYIQSDEDFEDIWLGMQLQMTATFRRPSFGNDDYEKLFKDAFGLPQPIAAAYAAKAESYDSVPGGGTPTAALQSAWRSVRDVVRRAVNVVGSPIGWEIDQDQSYDMDILFEFRNVGRAAKELFSRARLMKGQALFNAQTGLLKAGDVADYQGDLYGDVIEPLRRRNIPSRLLGNLAPIAGAAKTELVKTLKAHIRAAKAGQANPAVARALYQIQNSGDPDPAYVQYLTGDVNYGPNDMAVMGDLIADEYGDVMAQHWKNGDLEAIVGDAMVDAGDPEPEGDVTWPIAFAEAQRGLGDLAGYGADIGDLMTRWRAKRALKKLKRRRKRTQRFNAKSRQDDADLRALEDANRQLEQVQYQDQSSDYQGGGQSQEEQAIPVDQGGDYVNWDQIQP